MPQPLYPPERASGPIGMGAENIHPHRDFIPRPPLRATTTNYIVPGHNHMLVFRKISKNS